MIISPVMASVIGRRALYPIQAPYSVSMASLTMNARRGQMIRLNCTGGREGVLLAPIPWPIMLLRRSVSGEPGEDEDSRLGTKEGSLIRFSRGGSSAGLPVTVAFLVSVAPKPSCVRGRYSYHNDKGGETQHILKISTQRDL